MVRAAYEQGMARALASTRRQRRNAGEASKFAAAR